MTAITVCLVLTGCSASVDGRGTAVVVPSPTGRVLGTPSADGPTTRGPETTGGTSTTTGTPTTRTTDDAPATTDAPTAEPGVPDVLSGPVSLEPGPDGYVTFQTPSGNIFCGLGAPVGDSPASVRCDLLEADYPDLVPQDCGDVGDFHPGTASLDGRGTAVVGACISDTVIDPSAVVLPYGSNARAGDVVCHSAEDGVTCGDLVTGRGFQVARTAHRVF